MIFIMYNINNMNTEQDNNLVYDLYDNMLCKNIFRISTYYILLWMNVLSSFSYYNIIVWRFNESGKLNPACMLY